MYENGVMAELPASDSWTASDDAGVHAFADLPVDATPEERALGASWRSWIAWIGSGTLATLPASTAARTVRSTPGCPTTGAVGLPRWSGDEDLVEGLAGRPVHEADLMLLASIDPGSLSAHGKVLYLQATDRVTARVVSLRHRTVVAMAGSSSTQAHLSEVAVENEISFARRTSRYSAGRAIETARALATAFPRFAAALHDGEVSPRRTARSWSRRPASWPTRPILGELERRVLPKAKRLPPGQFAGEVAKAIARLDRDAAARVKNARATRRVWVRQLEDGMGYLGLTHDWSTIHAIHEAVATDGRCLQVARGGSGAVADGVEDATADACRADALAARVLGEVHEDGSVSWDRSEVAVTVNVVMDLDTLRGESDQIALLDGQPVPGEIGREVAQFATWWRRLVTDPVDGHLLDYGRTHLPPRPAPPLRPRPRRRMPVTRTAAPAPPPGCRWTTPPRSPTDHRTRGTPGRCAPPATSSRPPATPPSPAPTPTGPAPGPPPGARPSTSHRDPCLPVEPDPPPAEPAPPIPEDPPPF